MKRLQRRGRNLSGVVCFPLFYEDLPGLGGGLSVSGAPGLIQAECCCSLLHVVTSTNSNRAQPANALPPRKKKDPVEVCKKDGRFWGRHRGQSSFSPQICALQPGPGGGSSGLHVAVEHARDPGHGADPPRPSGGQGLRVRHAPEDRDRGPQLLTWLGGRQHGPLQLHIETALADHLRGAQLLPALPRQERRVRGWGLPKKRSPSDPATQRVGLHVSILLKLLGCPAIQTLATSVENCA